MRHSILTAIDVGTHAITGLTAKRASNGQIEILAQEEISCFGVRNGEVARPEYVAQAVQKIRQILAEKSGFKIRQAVVNVSGSHLFPLFSQGLVSVSRADQKISQEDVQRVLRAAKAVNLPANKEILTVLPKEFIVDGESGLKQPVGLEGIRLEAKVLLVCLFTPVLENLGRSFTEADLGLADVVASPLAASRAVLSEEQKELGVAMIDIGAGTTSLIVFDRGEVIGFEVFPIGSANITNDIAIGLRTEIQTAEKIKLGFASLEPAKQLKKAVKIFKTAGRSAKIKTANLIEVPEKGLVFPREFLGNIVESRVSQIFAESQKALKKILSAGQLPCGIVLTGGGANLPGIVNFAKNQFNLPCRLGTVREIGDIERPELSVCAGLLLEGFAKSSHRAENLSEKNLKDRLRRLFRLFLP